MSKRKYTKEFKLKVLKEHEEGASFYSEWYKFDGIHPNKNGANVVATTIYNFLK